MRTIVRFLDQSEVEFDIDTLASQPGLLILIKGEIPVGTFVINNIAGIYHPDGAPKVEIAKVSL